MSRKRGILSAIITFAQVCALAAVIALSHGGAGVKAAGSVAITGTVTNQQGAGIANVSVYATDPGGNTVEFGPSTSASDGTYELDVEAGTYDFHFDPQNGSNLNPIVDSNVTVLNNQTIDIQLVPLTHTLSGTLLDTNNNSLSGVTIGLSNYTGGSCTSSGLSYSAITDAHGDFSITVPAGSYCAYGIVEGTSGTTSTFPNLPNLFELFGGPLDLTTGNVSQNIQLPPTTTMTVVTKDANGNPVSNVPISIGGDNASASIFPGSTIPSTVGSFGATAGSTDTSGNLTATVWQNASFASGEVCAQYPEPVGSVCNTSPISTTNGSITVVLVTPVTHTLSGTLLDTNNNSLSGVTIGLSNYTGGSCTSSGLSYSAITDAHGDFSITVPAGSYCAYGIVEGTSGTTSTFPNLPNLFELFGGPLDLTTGNVSQNIQLPPTTTMTVVTKDANGNPVSNVPISIGGDNASASIFPGSTIPSTVGSFGATAGSTDTSGNLTATVWQNASFASGEVCAQYPEPVGSVCNTSPISTTNGSITVVLVTPVTHTLSGTLLDTNNNSLSGVTIGLSNYTGGSCTSSGLSYSAITDAHGDFSITVPAGSYCAYGIVEGTSGTTSTFPNLPNLFELFGGPLDLTTGNVSQNIQLPPTTTMTVVTKDANGNPVSNVPISIGGDNASASIFPGSTIPSTVGSFGATAGSTDTSGNLTATVWQNASFASGEVCAQYPEPVGSVCNTSPISTTNGSITVVLQQEPPSPSAPTNLTAQSPAQNPSLAWTGTSGAISYNIYRNSVKIDSTTSTSYTDNSAPEGTDSYYVTAVNDAGESGPSNSVNVLVDRTPPTITYSVSPTPNSNGWNNGSVTVTFTCADNNDGSGIASCTLPVTLSNEGADQTVTGIATDNADNTASVTTSPINIDETAPLLGTPTWSTNPISSGQGTTLTVPATDNLSGVVAGEYYIGSVDPGEGNGTTMGWDGDNLTATIGANLTPGIYTINIRAEDAAGNWSAVTSTTLTVGLPTPNLTAQSPAQYPVLTWDTDPYAAYYNIYRDGTEISTTTDTTFTDNSAPEGTDSYYVIAVAADDISSDPSNTVSVLVDRTPPIITYTVSPTPNTAGWNNSSVTVTFHCTDNTGGSGIASCPLPETESTDGVYQLTGTAVDKAGNATSVNVTVNVDKTPPTITYTLSSQPDSYGWYNKPVTITFTCSDNLSGVASCPSPKTISTQGENQSMTVNATDNAGNSATLTVSGINIDTTPPSVSAPSMSSTLILISGQKVTVTSDSADSLSGVVGGEFYIDTDPGDGKGIPMTYSNGKLTATASISGLSLGEHTLYIRAEDAAGNWSSTVSVSFLYIGL